MTSYDSDDTIRPQEYLVCTGFTEDEVDWEAKPITRCYLCKTVQDEVAVYVRVDAEGEKSLNLKPVSIDYYDLSAAEDETVVTFPICYECSLLIASFSPSVEKLVRSPFRN